MAFTQPSRVWWNTSAPGAGTNQLEDATPSATTPASANEDTGIEGTEQDRLFRCERSGFTVPFSETVIDPVSGHRVWYKFADTAKPEGSI